MAQRPGVAVQVAFEKAKFVTGFSRWVKGQAQGLQPGPFKLYGQAMGQLSSKLHSPPPLRGVLGGLLDAVRGLLVDAEVDVVPAAAHHALVELTSGLLRGEGSTHTRTKSKKVRNPSLKTKITKLFCQKVRAACHAGVFAYAFGWRVASLHKQRLVSSHASGRRSVVSIGWGFVDHSFDSRSSPIHSP